MKLTVYHATWCPLSRDALKALAAAGIEHEAKDVDTPGVMAEMEAKGGRGVPFFDSDRGRYQGWTDALIEILVGRAD